jgi:outer membrane protein TolC
VNAAQAAVDVSFVQYREGQVDFQRVLDSQRVLLESQNTLTDTQSTAMTNLIGLYKALGGGWELYAGNPVVNVGTQREMEERNQ